MLVIDLEDISEVREIQSYIGKNITERIAARTYGGGTCLQDT